MEIVTTVNSQNLGIVMPKGRIDTTTALDFDSKIKSILDKGIIKIIIDFSHTDFISSAGIRILIVKAKEAKNLKGEIVLSNMSQTVQDVFEVSGFDTIFSIYKTVEDATKVMLA